MSITKPYKEEEDFDDQQCVCGVYRSEHQMMGCPEGFQTAEAWKREHDTIKQMVNDGWEWDEDGTPIRADNARDYDDDEEDDE